MPFETIVLSRDLVAFRGKESLTLAASTPDGLVLIDPYRGEDLDLTHELEAWRPEAELAAVLWTSPSAYQSGWIPSGSQAVEIQPFPFLEEGDQRKIGFVRDAFLSFGGLAIDLLRHASLGTGQVLVRIPKVRLVYLPQPQQAELSSRDLLRVAREFKARQLVTHRLGRTAVEDLKNSPLVRLPPASSLATARV